MSDTAWTDALRKVNRDELASETKWAKEYFDLWQTTLVDAHRLDWFNKQISVEETADILGIDRSKCCDIRQAIDAARAQEASK